MPVKCAAIKSCTTPSDQPSSLSTRAVTPITPTIAACARPVATIAVRTGVSRNSSPRERGGGGAGCGSSPR